MDIVYKEETYVANIILRDFGKKKSHFDNVFLPILFEVVRIDLLLCDNFRNSEYWFS